MLFEVFSKIFHRSDKRATLARKKLAELEEAAKRMAAGDTHGAIFVLRKYLECDPSNVQALNDLGACLADIGDIGQASATFELAYALDDTYIPVVVNHAKLLHDRRLSAQAMPLLRQAKIYEPSFSHTDAVYAGIALMKGDVSTARRFQLRAWLANFDNLRLANCHLFYAAYDDIDERSLAAEHRFWAETIRPLHDLENSTKRKATAHAVNNRVRIGYWSPDFRSHSVRYFFRPLINNHDKTQFEVFLFHDFPKMDVQTEHIKARGEHFFDVSQMSDDELCEFILAKQLDVLVELAGHSSHNRIALLQRRLANVQISAIGYPPTSGLHTIDAKIVDGHTVNGSDSCLYTEFPAPLRTSFWCFDPMEEAYIAPESPCIKNGYLTLGCVGNLAKINCRILVAWRQILDVLTGSRLLLRSISLEDDEAEGFIRRQMKSVGIDLRRVDFHKPKGGADFFDSYNSIDIILDTFPFNGGTTTCFATYMGVPVVSMYGEALMSRMGLSILSNLNAPDLAVSGLEAYVARVIELASDAEYLRTFRREARTRFSSCSLGNGEMYAREFEECVVGLLEKKRSGEMGRVDSVAILPAVELVRRGYAVFQSGNVDGALRIVDHCLKAYPNSASSHLLKAQQWLSTGEYSKAIGYLQEALIRTEVKPRFEVQLTLARMHLLAERPDHAQSVLHAIDQEEISDTFDQMQYELYESCLMPNNQPLRRSSGYTKPKQFGVLIVCDDAHRFEEMESLIRKVALLPTNSTLHILRCDESRRVRAYQSAIEDQCFDVIVIAQKNIEIVDRYFFVQLCIALETADFVSFAGAARWSRLDWRLDDIEFKLAGFIAPSTENTEFVEVQLVGLDTKVTNDGMAILDGTLFAFNCRSADGLSFDNELSGCGTLLEEDWIHQAFKLGRNLMVHRNLGVFIDSRIGLDVRDVKHARLHCTNKYEFDPFATVEDSRHSVSAPVKSCTAALCAMDHYFFDQR